MANQSSGFNRPLLAAAGLLSLTAMAEMGMINIALPQLTASLGISIGAAQWAIVAYQLPLALLLIPMGIVLDSRPQRRIILVALGIFAVSGIAGWVTPQTPGLWWIIVVRCIQGAAAAVLFVMMPVLAIRSAPPGKRPIALSVTAAMGPVGAILGPILGGLAVDAGGWRAAFLIKIPFVLVAAVLILKSLPADARVPRRPPAGGTGERDGVPPMAQHSVRASVARRLKGIAQQRALHGLLGGTVGLAAALQAMQFTLSYVFQLRGWSASRAAIVMITFAVVMAGVSLVAGRLAQAIGPPRIAITAALVVTIGFLVLTLALVWSVNALLVPSLLIIGAGMGLYGGPTQAWVMASAPPDATATVASTMQLARTTGFTVGPLVAGLTLTVAPGGDLSLIGASLCAAIAAACFITTRRRQIGTTRHATQ